MSVCMIMDGIQEWLNKNIAKLCIVFICVINKQNQINLMSY